MTQQIHNLKPLKEYRRALRSNGTPEEAMLWKALRNSQLEGKKFRRQHSIGNYIVDFYCPSEKLVIELDGQPHFNPGTQANDHERDEWLKAQHFKVLRFENYEVRQDVNRVLDAIRNVIVG